MIKLSNPLNVSQSTAAKRSKIASVSQSNVHSQPGHEEIARRAYAIYVKRGYPAGQSEQNWLEAERELQTQGGGCHTSSCCQDSSVLKTPRRL